MGFRLFASGTGDFRMTKEGIDEGDVYEVGEWINRMNSASGGARGIVENEVTGAATPDSPLQQFLNAGAQMIGAHLFRTNLMLLLGQKHEVVITVRGREEHLLWPDTGGIVTRTLTTRDRHPVRYFFQDVSSVLAKAELKTFGALAALAEVFARYDLEVPNNYPNHRLLIVLSH